MTVAEQENMVGFRELRRTLTETNGEHQVQESYHKWSHVCTSYSSSICWTSFRWLFLECGTGKQQKDFTLLIFLEWW